MSDPQPQQFYYVGVCRICGTGPLGLRTCGECDRLVVVCDECDVVWTDDDFSQPPAATGTTLLPCPHCASSLYDDPSHWSTREEISACDWLKTSRALQRLNLESGQAITPQVGEPDPGNT